jgi:hypothetical protein
MPFTGQLGGAASQLGKIVLGGLGQFPPLPFGFTPHVLDARTVRVQFDDQVDASALQPGAYSMLAVSGPVPNFVPSVASVAFYDADHRSVALTLNQALTFTTVYALSIVGVTSPDGNSVTPSAGNFRANVPDPPRAQGAFLSQRGMIDIYFDRAVGPTSPGSAATIQASVGGTPQAMTRIPWSSALPANVLRFELAPAMDVASAYTIDYFNVIDASYNTAPGQVPLSLTLQAPQPYSYAVLSNVQMIDAWVDSISNAVNGYNRALINVFFNCTMSHADIINTSNWTVTSGGVLLPILSVRDWGSALDGLAFNAIDSRTYFAQVEVSATASTAPYVVTAQVRSEDLARTTNPADYTGSISVLPLATPPRIVGTKVNPQQASFRFDLGINLPTLQTLQVVGPNGPIRTSSVIVTASVQSLVLALTDLMASYNQHIIPVPYGAGHIVTDVINYFLPSEFPQATMASAIAAVNRVRDVYLDHASSTVYHNFPDPNLIRSPYATDFPSAVALADALINSFSNHNLNVGVHNTAGAPLYSAKLYDTLSVGLGMMNGAPYQLSAQSQYFFIDIRENTVPMRFLISAPFIGVEPPPFVASAIPKTGIVETNNGVRFEQDAVIVFFSKPIQPAALIPPDIVITGPPGLVTQGFEWVDSRVLSIGVIGMAKAQYSLDIFGVQDLFGNGIVSA